MTKLIGENFEEWRKGEHLKIPENPTEFDEWLANFCLTVYKIIRENHVFKWDGKRQMVAIFSQAMIDLGIEGNFECFYEGPENWGIRNINCSPEEFVMNLHAIQERFSKIYRHHAQDFAFGDNEGLPRLTGGN